MPPTSPNPNNTLGWGPILQRIQALELQLATYQTTTAVKDNHGDTVAIIGNISTDPQTGLSTGIAAGTFGIAVLVAGVWTNVATL